MEFSKWAQYRHRLNIAISIDNPGPNEAATTCSRPPPIERKISSTISTVGLEEFPRVRYISLVARRCSSDRHIDDLTPSITAVPPGCSAQSKSEGCKNTAPVDAEYSVTNLANIRATVLLAQYGIARSRMARGPVGCKSGQCYPASRWNPRLTGFMDVVAHVVHSTWQYCIVESK